MANAKKHMKRSGYSSHNKIDFSDFKRKSELKLLKKKIKEDET